ncbi:hypothetical protein MHYP_G00022070 [Metynnis hypsauchen]
MGYKEVEIAADGVHTPVTHSVQVSSTDKPVYLRSAGLVVTMSAAETTKAAQREQHTLTRSTHSHAHRLWKTSFLFFGGALKRKEQKSLGDFPTEPQRRRTVASYRLFVCFKGEDPADHTSSRGRSNSCITGLVLVCHQPTVSEQGPAAADPRLPVVPL